MATGVYCTTGPYGTVAYGQLWAYNQTTYAVPDNRKFTGQLSAIATNYGEITLSWTLPQANLIDRYAVVRASYGSPRSRYTGFTVIESASDGPIRSTADGNLFPARWYYYSLYVRETSSGRWILAGTAQQMSVRDWGHHKEMMDSLPAWYRLQDRALYGTVEQGPLYRFLQLFAFEFDLERTLAKSVEQSRSMPDVGAQMLPSYASDLGVNYEAVFGDAKMRGILDRIIKWRKGKGDQEVLTEIVRTLSACSDGFVELVPNILLDHNDSGFDEPTIGRWSVLANAQALVRVDPGGRSSGGYLKVKPVIAGDVAVGSSTNANIKVHGIKVEPNTVYTASTYVRSVLGNGKTVSVLMDWFDIDGNQITTFYEPGGINSLGPFGETPFGQVWWEGPNGPPPYGTGDGDTGLIGGIQTTVVPGTGDWESRAWTTQQAPANARFVRVVLFMDDLTLGSTEYRFDEIQLEVGSTPTKYEPARKVKVFACGDRKNVIENPSFEADARRWAAINTDLELNDISQRIRFGSQSLNLAPINPGPVSVSTTALVNEAKYYTFSAFLLPVHADVRVTLSIEWMDDNNEVLRVSSKSDTLTKAFWNRPALTDVGPVGATKAAFSVIVYPRQGEEIALDAVLAEAGTALQDYFDGSFEGEDWQWVGEDNNSQSIFIANRQVFAEVLGRYMDEFVPATTPWEIVYTA